MDREREQDTCGRDASLRQCAASGLTLIEALVAWTLSLTILVGALSLTQSLRRSFQRIELAADAQQRARIAVESIAYDLRRAGLGVDPDGAPGRPDETIEGAWAGAIVARGDLDGEDPAARNDPERWIPGRFPSTRTGNDEIFAYALRAESGTGGSELVFEADVASPVPVGTPGGDLVAPRDGIVEPVRLTRIVGADGGNAGPGCVLYRASLANNATVWGTGNAIVWQPLADSIAALRFRYFDEEGIEIASPGGAEAGSGVRARIASVEVRVVALEKHADPEWRDPSDPSPRSVHYRRAEDALRVALRSAGLVARSDQDGIPVP